MGMHTTFEPTHEERFRFGQARGIVCQGALTLASGVLVWNSLAAAQPVSSASPSVREFLPDQADSKTVTVSKHGPTTAEILIVTQAVAVKESGPKATVERFGEVYAFSPAFVAVRREQPIEITFWNLQPDDEHDFALLGSNQKIVMSAVLKPLSKTSYVFTFHREGLFDFKCLEHQPEMNGQILVMPAK
jgi:plastocyanin